MSEKIYEVKITMSEKTLEKITDIERACNSEGHMAMLDLMMMAVVKRKLEDKGSITVDVDEFFKVENNRKEEDLLVHSIATIGLLSTSQEQRKEEKKEAENIKIQNNVGSSSSYFGGATPKIGEDTYNYGL